MKLKLAIAALLLAFCTMKGSASLGITYFADRKSDSDESDNEQFKKFVRGKERTDGFFPFYWDAKTGKIYLGIKRLDEEFLYVQSLATGLGSNPVGLDRGQLGDQKVVRFTRVGPKVLLWQKNLRFRAATKNQLEKRAVQQSFAESILWAGKVEAESEEEVVVDVTDLLISDAHGVIGTLKRSEQGDFSLDKNRSAVHLASCKAFPKNTELEATLTFSGKNPGRYVRQTTPTSHSVTLRQHHSFVELPDDQYRPRKYDVRSPCMSITFSDYATALDQPLEQRWILRHRLQKKVPGDAPSEPVEPIVYYVDAGAPAQIQKALVEGAQWWNEAFEAAGFKNAFQVKLLPGSVDPLDVRYNVIQWVHRSTRGWSYGGSVIDPRTGEIIKGHVTLGSLRVRQDQLLFNSLDGKSAGQNCACCGVGGIPEESTLVRLSPRNDSLATALARIRQLSAHEVGHTLGFVHNFAASTYGDRASVMDYPAPRIKITNGQLDFSDAYGVGIGIWDRVSVKFAYGEFEADKESDELDRILNAAESSNLLFVSDADARPAGAAHPMANLWDNGVNPLEELEHVMKVRKIALEQFDASTLPSDTTTADIAQYLTPVFLHHRYQLASVGKLIGGHIYRYGYDAENANLTIQDSVQQSALTEMLNTIHPRELVISDRLVSQISPRPYSTIRDQEILPSWSGRIFDPLAAAKVAIEMTLDELFQPQRLNRLYVQSRQANRLLTPASLVSQVVQQQWELKDLTKSESAINSVAKEAIANRLMKLADDEESSVAVRTSAHSGLKQILIREASGNSSVQWQTHLYRKVKQFLQRPVTPSPEARRPETPPGSPIGT